MTIVLVYIEIIGLQGDH